MSYYLVLIIKKTKALFFDEQNNILKTSFWLMILVAITKISGFLYLSIAAERLGAVGGDRPFDLFILANTIPEILGNLILVGVISAVFIPILIKALNREGTEHFLRVYNSLLNFGLLVFVILSIVLAITAEHVFPFVLNTLIRPNEIYTPRELQQIVEMMRLLLIPQIFLGISTFYSSGLNIYHRFVIPQLAPLFYNLGRIIGAYFLIPISGGVDGVMGLVWGTLLGSFFHLAIQFPLVLKVGIKHLPVLDLKDRYFREAIKVGLPRIVGLGAEQIASGIDRFIAARFVAGSVTVYSLAISLISIPLSLFGLTFSVASFPVMSKHYQNENYAEFKELFARLFNQIMFLSVPVTVILLILRVSLVRLTFGLFGGEFTFESTYLTAWVVAFFALGLVFESLRTLLYRVFYAANDTVRPLYTATFTVVLGIITGVLFTNYFSHFNTLDFALLHWDPSYFFNFNNEGKAAVGGLALSSSLVYTTEFCILMYLIDRRIVDVKLKRLAYDLFLKIVAGIIMGLVMFSFFKLWGNTIYQQKTLNLIILVGLTSMIGMLVYLWSCFVLHVKEFDIVKSIVLKLYRKNDVQPQQ